MTLHLSILNTHWLSWEIIFIFQLKQRSEHISSESWFLLSQQIPLLRVYEVLIKLIILTIALIDLVTFHLMIYDIKSHHWCNLCTKCMYNWTKLYVFHICGGHFEYFKLLKGGNVPPTWNCSLRPYRWIIKKEKNFIIQFYPDPHGCRTTTFNIN